MTTRAHGSWEVAHTIRTPDGFRCRVVGSDGRIAAIVHGRTAGECEAAARLIAAAPDYAEAAGLAITALSFALEHAINKRDDVAAAQYSAARKALIWADNQRTGRDTPTMKDVTPLGPEAPDGPVRRIK